MDIPICPVHNVPMTLKPAGVSKATGRQYKAFWACGEKMEDGSYCRAKPIDLPPTTGRKSAEAQFVQGLAENKRSSEIKEMHEEKTENIAKSVALNNAVNFIGEIAGKYSRFSDYDETLMELMKLANEFYTWLKNGKEGK